MSPESVISVGAEEVQQQAVAPAAKLSFAPFAVPAGAESDALAAVARRERVQRASLAAADALAAIIAVPVALLASGHPFPHVHYLPLALVTVIVAKLLGLYDNDDLVIRKSTLDEVPRLANLATTLVLLTWFVRGPVGAGPSVDATEMLGLWVALLGAIVLCRIVARRLVVRFAPRERCVLIGDEAVLERLEDNLARQPGAVLAASVQADRELADPAAVKLLAETLDAHRLILAPSPRLSSEELIDLVRAAKATGLRVTLVPDILGAVGSSVAFDNIGGMTLLGVRRFGLTRSSQRIKRAFDLLGAGVLLAVCALPMAVIAVLIKLDSPGPVFYRQQRVGRDGERFAMVKFRTMVDGAHAMRTELASSNEARDGLFKIADDPRVTRVGRWLRPTSLDELPQLFNIVRGEMSLVGPRPLVADEDERITGFDRRRLTLTPGMTGHWQTLGSSLVPLSEMVKIDYLYVANWSLWGDVKLILRTIPVVLWRRNR